VAAPTSSGRFARLAEHPWLVGEADADGAAIGDRARRLSIIAIVTANVVGALVVVSFAVFALPKPQFDAPHAVLVNMVAAAGYVAVALALGVRWGRRGLEDGPRGTRAWLHDDRDPDPEQQRRMLLAPLRIMVLAMVLWAIAAVAFTLLNLAFSGLLALGVGLTVALGGLTTSAAAYLLTEIVLRPVAARALAQGSGERRGVPGVAVRWGLSWALGSGVPILGLILVGIVGLTHVQIDARTLAVTMVTLGGIGIAFGAFTALLAAIATVHPIRSIEDGLERVRQGDLETELGVWDSTEMGRLQAGFNDMVTGLRERERIRDLFGRQVGADVAREAMADEVRLGGEVRDVSVLFVDLVGSTTLAGERPPEEVVALLNRFFAEVVDVVEANGGWINKFEGDAALAIFGAPLPVDDAQERALRTARELDVRLRERVPELEAGIGVACGPVVAGNIGAEHRFEYTVIGDAVNQAARLTDLAKGCNARVMAAAAVLAGAGEEEAARWELGEEHTLRGRSTPTRAASPRA
jgi:adenylate cyclase